MVRKPDDAQMAIVPAETAHPAPGAEPSVAVMIETALKTGIGPDGLEKLVDLYERMDARRAEREYAAALAAFQRDLPKITKESAATKDGGRVLLYRFASIEHIMRTIRPSLDAHGFSVSFNSEIEESRVTAHCIVRHAAGHQTMTTFTAPIGAGTSIMSDAQRVGAATSFAMRYALRMAFGLTPEGEDDDGASAGQQPITAHQAEQIETAITEIGVDRDRFLAFLGVQSIAEIPARDYRRACNALESKRRQNGGAR